MSILFGRDAYKEHTIVLVKLLSGKIVDLERVSRDSERLAYSPALTGGN
jgi:hypothetical protein